MVNFEHESDPMPLSTHRKFDFETQGGATL